MLDLRGGDLKTSHRAMTQVPSAMFHIARIALLRQPPCG